MFLELFLVPLMPFLGFVFLLLFGRKMSAGQVAWVGVSSIMVSAGVSIWLGLQFIALPSDQQNIQQLLWHWMSFANFSFRLDALSLLMICVVSVVASLIALFSVGFMRGESGLARFFASMDLFVAAMLTLVLADNLLLLYLGWEGVGLCSYLLIGFWYQDAKIGRSAMKAFITTRIGDVFLLIAILFIWTELGTLDIQTLTRLAPEHWAAGSMIPTLVAFCILGGAVGKSAQLPLQTWLPDAMVGPTPVSALIHAATMVTAGVYLIARLHGFFILSSEAMAAVLVVGMFTLLLAGFSALVQKDIKRVLAYSTISQLGYMFLALGVGAYSAAMFHLLTHAVFKALLFLGAGVIGHAMHHSYDMTKMGGLRKELPFTFWTFAIGSACLASLPLVTAGFYSKELILSEVYASPLGGLWPWVAGLVGAFVTAAYTFRMVRMVFFGDLKEHVHQKPDFVMALPLGVLALFSLSIGFIQMPPVLASVNLLKNFLHGSLEDIVALPLSHPMEWKLLWIASGISVTGAVFGWVAQWRQKDTALGQLLTAGFGFDALYHALLVKPYVVLSRWLRADWIRELVKALVWSANLGNHLLSATQNGRIRNYATVLVAFATFFIWYMVRQ